MQKSTLRKIRYWDKFANGNIPTIKYGQTFAIISKNHFIKNTNKNNNKTNNNSPYNNIYIN